MQDNTRSIQQIISAFESNTGYAKSRVSGSIMGGRNEQSNMRSRENGNDFPVQAVNSKRINAQITTGSYDIEIQNPETYPLMSLIRMLTHVVLAPISQYYK